MNNFNWVDEQEKKNEENRGKDYFKVVEGANKFVLLSHCAPLAQVFDTTTKKYRPAEEGDANVSIKGVCWVLQEEVIKQAMLPYTVVKQIRDLQQDSEWDFKIPFPHVLTLTAKGAGTKEVEYNLTPSPKEFEIPQTILDELAKKISPEEAVEKIKGKTVETKAPDYPEEEIDPSGIPF